MTWTTNSPSRLVQKLVEQSPSSFAHAAVNYIDQACSSTKATLNDAELQHSIELVTYTIRVVSRLCFIDAFASQLRFDLAIPPVIAVIRIMTEKVPFSLGDRNTQVLLPASKCVFFIVLAAETIQGKAWMEVAFRHKLLRALCDLSPWIRWGARQPTGDVEREVVEQIRDALSKRLGPYLIYDPVLRQARKDVTNNLTKFQSVDMGILFPIWKEILRIVILSWRLGPSVRASCGWREVS